MSFIDYINNEEYLFATKNELLNLKIHEVRLIAEHLKLKGGKSKEVIVNRIVKESELILQKRKEREEYVLLKKVMQTVEKIDSGSKSNKSTIEINVQYLLNKWEEGTNIYNLRSENDDFIKENRNSEYYTIEIILKELKERYKPSSIISNSNKQIRATIANIKNILSLKDEHIAKLGKLEKFDYDLLKKSSMTQDIADKILREFHEQAKELYEQKRSEYEQKISMATVESIINIQESALDYYQWSLRRINQTALTNKDLYEQAFAFAYLTGRRENEIIEPECKFESCGHYIKATGISKKRGENKNKPVYFVPLATNVDNLVNKLNNFKLKEIWATKAQKNYEAGITHQVELSKADRSNIRNYCSKFKPEIFKDVPDFKFKDLRNYYACTILNTLKEYPTLLNEDGSYSVAAKPLIHLKKIMGHEKLENTDIYDRINAVALPEIVENLRFYINNPN